MKIDLINPKGERQTKEVDWPKLPALVKPALLVQAIRVYLTNQRQAKAKAKTRGEVAGTTKKIWKQKGTGNARHGSRKAPIFVGGGKAHGPTGLQNFKRRLNKKVIPRLILSVLKQKNEQNSLFLVQTPEFTKTSEAYKYWCSVLGEVKTKRGLVITDSAKDKNLIRYTGNLDWIKLASVNQLNVYQLLAHQPIYLTEAALLKFNQQVDKQ